MKKIFALLALVIPMLAFASGGDVHLDTAPERNTDLAGLQRGAKLFVNYCLNCHGASMVRYNRLKDIGLTEQQIKDNLLFTGDKVGDMMNVAMKTSDAKEWFGAKPPDLSLIARAKASEHGTGSDWVYTFLRSFYRDNSRPTGWNNALENAHNTAMPFALWELQGKDRGATVKTIKQLKDEKGNPAGFEETIEVFGKDGSLSKQVEKLKGDHHHEGKTVTLDKAEGGKLTAAEYDAAVGDLVGFMAWMADPGQNKRKQLGVWVLIFLALFWVIAWRLNAAYWKDIK